MKSIFFSFEFFCFLQCYWISWIFRLLSFFWYSYGGSDDSWYKKEVRYTFSDSEQCERHEWFYYSRDGVDEYTRSYTYTLKGNVVVLNDYNKTTLYLLKDYKGDIFLSSQGCESPSSNIYYEQE